MDPQIERRVDSLLAQLTLEEKIALIGGVNGFDFPGLPRLDIPELGTADSPFGVRAVGPSTAYAGGIALAATWNPELARRVGTEIGRDARARGRHYSLGPGVNIYRSPLNGRNFEYLGEDPFLGSRLAVAFIEGMQSQGVSATVKHYVGNQSEFGRNVTDSRIDERTLREIYLPIFEAAVKEAKVGAIMPAYNLTNGAYMTANRRLLVDVAKTEWGFPGVMMSDWGAVHSALDAANGGTDIEMPGPVHFNRDSLMPLLKDSRVSIATLDDKVRRLLRNVVRFGWMDRPQLDRSIPRLSQSGREAAVQGAREAMVLLRNQRDFLPFDPQRVRTVAVIGPNAYPAAILGGGSAVITTYHSVSFLEGISDHLGASGTVLHARGIPSVANVVAGSQFTTAPDGGAPGLTAQSFATADMAGAPVATHVDRSVNVGRPFDLAAFATGEPIDFSLLAPARPLAMRWTGYYTPREAGMHDVVVQQGNFITAGYRLFVDDKLVTDRWSRMQAALEGSPVQLDARPHKVVLEYHYDSGPGGPLVRMGVVRQAGWVDPAVVEMASKADAVVLAVGFDAQSEAEGWDRTFALPPGQEELIRRVVAVNRNVVVVVTSGGGVDMSRWIDSVPAVVQAWFPGQEGGRALAEILYGDVNPSGHLPATFERRLEDNPSFAHYYPEQGTNRIEYREGVFVGYRGFEKNGVAPLFPFGHGLSYTTFGYANLSVTPVPGTSGADSRWEASFDVTNSGKRAGAVVAQLYVGDVEASVPRPPRELKGFAKAMLQPGETKRLTIPLDVRSLAYYDAARSRWRAEGGAFDVMVGSSSADIALRGRLTLPHTITGR